MAAELSMPSPAPGRAQPQGFAAAMQSLRRMSWAMVLITAVTVVLVIVPLVVLLVSSLTPGNALPFTTAALTLANYERAFADPIIGRLVVNTLKYAGMSLVLAMFAGISLAWLTERTDLPFKVFVRAAIFFLFAMPGLLVAYGWILLLGPNNGMLTMLLRDLIGERWQFEIYSLPGMVFVTALNIVPVVWILVSAVLRMVPAELEDAARASGANSSEVLRTVTLPVLLPGLLSATIYVFMILLQTFDVPLAIGLNARVPVLATHIYLLAVPELAAPRYGLASTFGIVLLVLAFIMMWFYLRATRVAERYQVVSGKGYARRLQALGRGRYPWFGGVLLLFMLMGGLPLLALFWASLLPFYQPFAPDLLSIVTLDNYRAVIDRDSLRTSALNTAVYMGGAATLCMLLSFLVSWLAVRSKARGARFLEVVAFLPLATPRVVFALAFLLFYIHTPLYGTVWVLLLAGATAGLAFGTRLMTSTLMQIHHELEQAAAVSGASWGRTLSDILLPLVFPAMLNGWLYVAITAFRDLTKPMILSTTGNEVLIRSLYLLWNRPDTTVAAALSVLMMLALLVIVVPLQYWAGRKQLFGLRSI
ncbi:MAG TPA: iron ABC transporter permease [Ramlibacter sp.]|nr:iron ABC transporter permease [Ramlibacter sp.]